MRYTIDDASYQIRFTPRKPRSIWSTINLNQVAGLIKQELMEQAGMKVYESRSDERSEIYAFEKKAQPRLDPTFEKKFKANKKARAFFQAQIRRTAARQRLGS